MEKHITIIKGDGIGPEIVTEAMKVLDAIAEKYDHTWIYKEILAGGCAIDAYGTSLTEEALDACVNSDSVLLGAVGGPKWDQVDPSIRPEKALLGIRKGMGLYANLRPATILPQLAHTSPLRKDIVDRGIDFMVVRELISGVYFGKKTTIEENGELVACDQMMYREHEIRRIAHTAFETARKRKSRVISVDKANVLDTSRLWRKIVHEVASEYPDVEVSDMLVDNCAMQIVKDPSQFDVVVTENMFGDILSDEASMITGSIGLIPSASLGESSVGMYEPIHGSAPDIAGKNIANPIGTILAAAMMLKYSFDLSKESDAIVSAVHETLSQGYRCIDIMEEGMKQLSCSEMGDQIIKNMK
ncbi:MAG: 3-isopropylmalate dehydrogenase [Erysipelotrichaceae bacterium]|nr:3-isopropylmalate dehydrogenase [Erysipelotrichaceae bacterium]